MSKPLRSSPRSQARNTRYSLVTGWTFGENPASQLSPPKIAKLLPQVALDYDASATPNSRQSEGKLTHSIRFQAAARKKAFAAKIDITDEEHLQEVLDGGALPPPRMQSRLPAEVSLLRDEGGP